MHVQSNFPSNTISALLALVSASFCACILLMISALFIYFRALQARIVILNSSYNTAMLVGACLEHLIVLTPIVYFGAAFGRFALRIAPPEITGRIRFGALVLTLLPLVLFALYPIPFLLYFFISSESLQTRQPQVIDSAIFCVLFFIWFPAFAFPLIKRHLKPLAFLQRPYVLFLRRFSRFSDRTVTNLVLRETPANKPVVFLVAPHSGVGDWNPFLVGFAGMKLLHPFRSVPLCVKSKDTEWEEAIQTLIKHAQFVVVDISEKSSAIETELEMINQAGCWQKTILLEEVSKKAAVSTFGSAESQTIHYRKSWIRGIPRMIIGYLAMHVSVITIFIIIVQSIDTFWFRILCLLLGIPLFGWIYISFFVRPSIDRTAKLSLKQLLRAR